MNNFNDIYIPIWYYFDFKYSIDNMIFTEFTFQYGTTSISNEEVNNKIDKYLHSNMVLLRLKHVEFKKYL